MLEVMHSYTSNLEGWDLGLKCSIDREHFDPTLRPLVIVPGYAMNSFIFGYHPSGLSMEAYLAQQGFEVWSISMRNQGESIWRGGSKIYGLKELILTDIPAAIRAILARTETKQDQVDILGASLGGTLMYAYVAMSANPRVGAMVAIGAPLRWEAIHPLLKIAFSVPELVGLVPMGDTRKMVRTVYPLIERFPSLLKIYMHPELTSKEHIGEMISTVDQPNRKLNRQMARWIRHGDMVIEGINITEAMRHVTLPVMCVLANADGIVPPETASSIMTYSGAEEKTLIEVGDQERRFAHADLFISHYSQELVFAPMAAWLKARYA